MHKLENLNFVLADLGKKERRPVVWNFYPSIEKAKEAKKMLLKESHEDYEHFSKGRYMAMSFDEYTEKRKQHYIKKPKKIKEEKYYDMLNCLPPRRFLLNKTYETFMMSEFITENITTQFIHIRETNEYWEANVDVKDESTYLEKKLGVIA